MIRAVHADGLLDPATGETARDVVVVIEDGRVTRAGRRATVQAPRDAETIDASGLTILPGLIDCLYTSPRSAKGSTSRVS